MFDYRAGIEEEFFVIDARTRNVRDRMPAKFFQACKRHLQDQVTNELLQSQIEVLTSPLPHHGRGTPRAVAPSTGARGAGSTAWPRNRRCRYASACSVA